MEASEFSSGMFILPPKADHSVILKELTAVALKQGTAIRGVRMTAQEANSILTLYRGLDDPMRDRLMAKTIPDMLAMTLRCRALSERSDRSWAMFEKKVG